MSDTFKDFLKIFQQKSFDYLYDSNYALKAEAHARNDLSIGELSFIKSILFENLEPVGLNVLDVGCNTGLPLRNFLIGTKKCRGFGIDVNRDAVLKVVENSDDIQLLWYDGHTIPFESNMFDHVILHHVIGHVKSPDLLLTEIHRVLKPNGTMSIVTPNLWYKFFIFPKNIIRNFKPDISILRYYSLQSLRKLLLSSEFKNNAFYYLGDSAFCGMNFARLRICVISKKIL